MDKFPLICGERPLGELRAEQEGLYTWFSAHCPPMEGIWCVFLLGERGTLRLGVLEPAGGNLTISRRISQQAQKPLGKLLRAELRKVGQEGDWEPLKQVNTALKTPWITGKLQGVKGILKREEGCLLLLAIPYDCGQPFPLTPLFCFAKPIELAGGSFLQFAFNEREEPVFP